MGTETDNRSVSYQHVKPTSVGHYVRPNRTRPDRCGVCGNAIKAVPANEGPEALKALFPL